MAPHHIACTANPSGERTMRQRGTMKGKRVRRNWEEGKGKEILVVLCPFPFSPLPCCPLMSIRLLALDLDGTLLNSRGKLSERNLQALNDARHQGVRIALVTGRRFRDARPIALELGLDLPLISHNGALTKHVQTLETVAAMLLPLEAAREVLRVGRAAGGDALVSDDPDGAGLMVYDHVSGDNRALAEYIRWARTVHGNDSGDAVRQVDSLEEYLDHAPVHVAFSGSCEPMRELAGILKRELGSMVKIFATLYPPRDFGLLDVVHPQASKAAGVAAAAAE